MTFVWPVLLLGLVLVPVLLLAYRWLLRRRSGRRDALARLGLISATPRVDRLRHVPAVLLLLGLTVLLVGLARPETTIADPHREGTVILAFDTSASMVATDVTPTRMDAAKAAARTFIDAQPESIKVGVVTFGGVGVVVQQPTTDKTAVLGAIDRLTPSGGTAVGAGILTALSAIAGEPIVTEDPSADPSGTDQGSGTDIGYYGGTAVIMLTDGENTEQPDPLDMADLASVAGVKIYPIGLGSPGGTVIDIDGYRVLLRLPWVLALLLIVPALLAAYVWQLRRRRRAAVRFSDVGLVRIAVPRQRRWRRHVGIGLVLAGLAALGVAAARPEVSVEVPVADAAVILALDVSGSMCATDVDPNRLTAAQDAVRAFIKGQDGTPGSGSWCSPVRPRWRPPRPPIGLSCSRRSTDSPPVAAPPSAPPSSSRSTRSPRSTARYSRSGRPVRPVRPVSRRVRPIRPRSPRSSSCSPTVPTPTGSARPMRPTSPPSAASGSTRSGSVRPHPRRWCARRASSVVAAPTVPAAASAGRVAVAGATSSSPTWTPPAGRRHHRR